MLKILQARLQLNSMWTKNFQMFKLDLEKAEEPDIKLPTSVGSSKKQESSRKNIYFCFIGSPHSSIGKESAYNVEDLGSIPGLGWCPGEGRGYPLQYSGLENSMDCIVHGVSRSWTQLSDFHFLLYWLWQSLWLCGSPQTAENSSRDGNTRPPDLPLEKFVCRSGSNS